MESPLLGGGAAAQYSLMEFVDAIEDGLISSDTLIIRRIIDYKDSTDEYKCSRYWEVLNANKVRIFCFGKRVQENTDQKAISILIISSTSGFQILDIKKLIRIGLPVYEVSGAGLLQFEAVRTIRGYTLRDKWKQLCKIRIPICLQLCPACMSPRTIQIANLDGTDAGKFKYSTTSVRESEFSIEFERGIDRKAKYMLFCSSILPFLHYFNRS